MNSFVYVIGSQDNPVKIGHGDRVETRVIALQIGNPDKLHIFGKVSVPWSLAEAIEAKAHALLLPSWRRGEWFNINADTAIRTIRVAKAMVESSNDNTDHRALLAETLFPGPRHPWAGHALQHYHEAFNSLGGSRNTEEMDRVIGDRAGMAALTAFRTILLNRGKLYGLMVRDQATYGRALAAAGLGLDALAAWYGERQEGFLLDEISGNAA
jgi:hypothetical protein